MKLSELHDGDVIWADDTFECLAPGPCKVKERMDGALYVECRDGQHPLSRCVGQFHELVGFSREKKWN